MRELTCSYDDLSARARAEALFMEDDSACRFEPFENKAREAVGGEGMLYVAAVPVHYPDDLVAANKLAENHERRVHGVQ